MKHSLRLLVIAVAFVVALAMSGCGSRDDSGGSDTAPGITDTEITLGGIFPFSGPASSYAVIPKAQEAYFKYINEEKGGVEMKDGKTRKIKYLVEDDGYEPSRTVTAAHKLIDKEQVFALYSTLGTPPNLAIWEFVNQAKVPQTFVASGASVWGSGIDAHPWTIGFQLAYTTEAAIWAKYLTDHNPDAKVAVLFANDDVGADYFGGFKEAIKGTNIKIIAEKSYETTDATVSAQMTELASSGADTFLNISTPKFAAQAIKAKGELGWDALQLLAAVSSSKATVLEPAGLANSAGVIYADFLKDPSNPAWADDADVKNYNELLAKYAPTVDALDRNAAFGWASAATLVATLEAMEEPTREALMKSVRNLNIEHIPMIVPGIPVITGDNDGYPVESAQLSTFNGTELELLGDVISYEGKTPIIKQ